jgi:hypothetical protein
MTENGLGLLEQLARRACVWPAPGVENDGQRQRLRTFARSIIEECARLAERCPDHYRGRDIAATLREVLGASMDEAGGA